MKTLQTFNLVSNGATVNTILPNTLRLPDGGQWRVALGKLGFYNSIFNITSANNKFIYTTTVGGATTTITLPNGAYEIKAINKYIINDMVNRGEGTLEDPIIQIIGNKNTLKTEIVIRATEANDYTIRFDLAGTFRKLLGFNSQTLSGQGLYISDVIANIENDIQSIRVSCNLVSGDYSNNTGENIATQSQSLYQTFRTTPPGYFEDRDPARPVFLPVNTNSISNIRLSLTDQNGRDLPIPIENKVVYTLLLETII